MYLFYSGRVCIRVASKTASHLSETLSSTPVPLQGSRSPLLKTILEADDSAWPLHERKAT